MRLLAIDPGKTSGCVLVEFSGQLPQILEAWEQNTDDIGYAPDVVAIEIMDGDDLGKGGRVLRMGSFIETARLEGQYLKAAEIQGERVVRLSRSEVRKFWGVKPFQKGNRDSYVRASLLMLYGGEKLALGTSKTPGPLHCLRSSGGHMWAAMALALAAEMPARLAMRGAA